MVDSPHKGQFTQHGNAQNNVADLGDAGVSQPPLDIILHQGQCRTDQDGNGGKDEADFIPAHLLQESKPVNLIKDTDHPVSSHFDHDTGEEGTHRGRSRRVSIGQPDMHRENTGLDAKTEHESNKSVKSEGGIFCNQAKIIKGDISARQIISSDEGEENCQSGTHRHKEVLGPGKHGITMLFVRHQHIGRYSHDFKENKQPQQVTGKNTTEATTQGNE